MANVASATRRLLTELEHLDAMVAGNEARSREIHTRIIQLKRDLEEGRPLPELLDAGERPLISDLITANIAALHRIGAEFRRAEVAALRTHGLTMEQIADLFGVSRQRISAIIKSDLDA